MRSKDNQVLASRLDSIEERVISVLEDVKEDLGAVKTTLATVSANQTAARDTHNTFRNELLGEGGRVFELERRQKSHETWQNIKFLVVLPVTLTLHKIARAMGINI